MAVSAGLLDCWRENKTFCASPGAHCERDGDGRTLGKLYFTRTRRWTCQAPRSSIQVSVSIVESRNGGVLLNCPAQKNSRVAVAVSPFNTTRAGLSRMESTRRLCRVFVIHKARGRGASVLPSLETVKSLATSRSSVAESRVRTASAQSCSRPLRETSTLGLPAWD
jgi:hypothetical protein